MKAKPCSQGPHVVHSFVARLSRFRVCGLWVCGFWVCGFWVWGLGFVVFGVWGLGFVVFGFGV